MAECVYCGSETELYDCGVPVCVKCSKARQNDRNYPDSKNPEQLLARQGRQSEANHTGLGRRIRMPTRNHYLLALVWAALLGLVVVAQWLKVPLG